MVGRRGRRMRKGWNDNEVMVGSAFKFPQEGSRGWRHRDLLCRVSRWNRGPSIWTLAQCWSATDFQAGRTLQECAVWASGRRKGAGSAAIHDGDDSADSCVTCGRDSSSTGQLSRIYELEQRLGDSRRHTLRDHRQWAGMVKAALEPLSGHSRLCQLKGWMASEQQQCPWSGWDHAYNG